MEIVANEKGIERRGNIGRIAGLASLIVLALALILSFTEIVPPLAMPLVLAVVLTTGVLFSIVGGYYVERYGGPHAHHRGVRSALKGLGNRFVLLQYVLPAPHVLLGPDGLTAIVVRSQTGAVTYANGKWTHHQKGKIFRELAGQERIGRPDEEAKLMVERLTRLVNKRLPDVEVPIRGAVLFIHPDLQLTLEDEPPVPVFYGKKLKAWLRGPGSRKEMPRQTWQQIKDALAGRLVGQEDEQNPPAKSTGNPGGKETPRQTEQRAKGVSNDRAEREEEESAPTAGADVLMEPSEYTAMYQAEEGLWWYKGMERITRATLAQRCADCGPRILDAGCGTGATTRYLKEYGTVTALDYSPHALAFSKQRGIERLTHGSVNTLPFADGSFDLVVSCDVICVLGVDDDLALREFSRVLAPGGQLLLRLPAHSWLRGAHDRAGRVRHRYTAPEVRTQVAAAGLHVEHTSYANMWLFPLAVVKRWSERFFTPQAGSDLTLKFGPLNGLFGALLSSEASGVARRGLPTGLTVVAVARKPSSDRAET